MQQSEGLRNLGKLAGSDIPFEATASSAGPLVWPPVESSEQRRRGFVSDVIDTTEALSSLLHEFTAFPFDEKTTRYSGRLFVTQDALTSVVTTQHAVADAVIEGIIPLEGCGVSELEDTSLVYLGRNTPERQASQLDMEQELAQARTIFSTPVNQASTHDYDAFSFQFISDVMRIDPRIHAQFFGLYQAFGWNEADVVSMLQRKTNVLLGVFQNGELVSTGMAERAILPVRRDNQGFPFVMYEITEAATREEYRGNGLYTAVAHRLNQHLTATDANLVYAESNLRAPGVLKAARKQGRHTVLESFEQYGLTPKPLRWAVRISGGSSDVRPAHEKNDLLVTYLVRKELQQLYGHTQY